MTLPASGQISLNEINQEFGDTSGTSSLDFDSMFNGVTAQNYYYNNLPVPSPTNEQMVNRNTAVGRTIYNTSVSNSNLQITQFYNYNDSAEMHWTHDFHNIDIGAAVDVEVGGYTGNIFSGGVDNGTHNSGSNESIGYFELQVPVTLYFPNIIPDLVDVEIFDTDTLESYYNTVAEDGNNFATTPIQIANIYGFQRFTLNINMYRI
jgi:hypothetical protein